jgi:hypothetical protein
MLAVKHLSASIGSNMIPLVDVAAPTKSADTATGVTYVERNIARTEKYVTHFSSVFVDSSELHSAFRLSGGVHPLEAIANAIARTGAEAIPVTGLHRDAAHRAATIAVANRQQRRSACIRLDATDVSTATLTLKRLLDLLNADEFRPELTYLLLDMQCLFGKARDAISNQLLRLFTLLNAYTWAGIIVGGYGLPDQISTAVATKDQGYVRRVEQDVFRDTLAYEMTSPRWFADYTILPPSVVELDWRLIRKVMSPKALYTLQDLWFVVRGGAFSSHPDEYAQYFSIADEIVALDEYCGAAYCYGDAYIADRSTRKGKPGSPGSWITACVNHHLTYTANAHAGNGGS